MKKMSIVKSVSVGGILTAMAVMFQSAPVFLPAIGLIFSPLSTLPIALSAFYSVSLGISVLFASAFVLSLVSMQEAIILLFTTGLLGVVIGILLYRKGILVSILSSSAILSLGMILLTYVMGIPAFVDLASSVSIPLIFLIFISFSLVYTSLWNIFLGKFINYLVKAKLINIS